MTGMLLSVLLGAAALLGGQNIGTPTGFGAMGAPVGRLPASWKMAGDRSVRPSRIRDDGQRTYLEWGAEQSLPAVFAIGPTGAEQVVDGYMRGGLFVIDRVHPKLVFRIDRDMATATRREARR